MLVCRIYAKRRHFQFSTGSLVAAWINRWTKAKNCVNKGASLMRDGICFCLHCQHCDTTTTRGKRRRKKPKWNSKLMQSTRGVGLAGLTIQLRGRESSDHYDILNVCAWVEQTNDLGSELDVLILPHNSDKLTTIIKTFIWFTSRCVKSPKSTRLSPANEVITK